MWLLGEYRLIDLLATRAGETNPVDVVIGAFIVVSAGVYLILSAYKRLFRQMRIEDTPTSRISSAPAGDVEVEGFLWSAPGQQIVQSLMDHPLLAQHLELQEQVTETTGSGKSRRTKRVWRTRWTRKYQPESLLVFDATGALLVSRGDAVYTENSETVLWRTLNAKTRQEIVARLPELKNTALPLDPGFLGSLFGNPWRFVERRLHPGQPVLIHGELKRFVPPVDITDSPLLDFANRVTNPEARTLRDLSSAIDTDRNGIVSKGEANQGYQLVAARYIKMPEASEVRSRGGRLLAMPLFGELRKQAKELHISMAHQRHLVRPLHFWPGIIGQVVLGSALIAGVLQAAVFSFAPEVERHTMSAFVGSTSQSGITAAATHSRTEERPDHSSQPTLPDSNSAQLIEDLRSPGSEPAERDLMGPRALWILPAASHSMFVAVDAETLAATAALPFGGLNEAPPPHASFHSGYGQISEKNLLLVWDINRRRIVDRVPLPVNLSSVHFLGQGKGSWFLMGESEPSVDSEKESLLMQIDARTGESRTLARGAHTMSSTLDSSGRWLFISPTPKRPRSELTRHLVDLANDRVYTISSTSLPVGKLQFLPRLSRDMESEPWVALSHTPTNDGLSWNGNPKTVFVGTITPDGVDAGTAGFRSRAKIPGELIGSILPTPSEFRPGLLLRIASDTTSGPSSGRFETLIHLDRSSLKPEGAGFADLKLTRLPASAIKTFWPECSESPCERATLLPTGSWMHVEPGDGSETYFISLRSSQPLRKRNLSEEITSLAIRTKRALNDASFKPTNLSDCLTFEAACTDQIALGLPTADRDLALCLKGRADSCDHLASEAGHPLALRNCQISPCPRLAEKDPRYREKMAQLVVASLKRTRLNGAQAEQLNRAWINFIDLTSNYPMANTALLNQSCDEPGLVASISLLSEMCAVSRASPAAKEQSSEAAVPKPRKPANNHGH